MIAPSLIPIRAGDRIKTDRRDAKNLGRLYRGGQLSYVQPPSPQTEGLRDLMRCRDDLRCARTAARHRVSKQSLRHRHLYRDGKAQWTKMHRAWIARQRLADELAHKALTETLTHLDGLDRQLDQLDRDLEQIARSDRWASTVQVLTRFKGVSTRTALGLISEIGDFSRFSHPRELCAWLGIVPSEYSSGQQRHRGHITKTGNHHARRLLVEAAWAYQHRPRRPDRGPEPDARAWQAQVRLHHRYRHLTIERGKRSTVATVALARELTAFLWAAATDEPFIHETPTDTPALESTA